MRRSLREAASWGGLAAVVAAGGALAWATHHPDAPPVVAAEEWPLVGPWVARLRARYVPPAPPPRDAGGAEVVVVAEWLAEDGGDGAPAGDGGHVWVAAGEPLRVAPDDGAAERGRIERFQFLHVRERHGEWVRVTSPTGEGWLRPFRGRDAGQPPLGRDPLPPRPLPGRDADPEVLALALAHLGVAEPSGRLGPYRLYTDAPRARLFALDRLAAAVEPAYRARYGRPPLGAARESVVLFSREADYRRFQDADEHLAGLPAAGHAGGGLVALFLGDTTAGDPSATLVHELAHLLNRRALGPALPPWLDEGIADDLAGSAITADGDLQPGRLGGSLLRSTGRVEVRGALASLRLVDGAFAAGRAVPLARLTAMEWDEFVRSESTQLHYAEASFFVRYLLDGGDPPLAAGFRRFLARVAEGHPPSGEALRAELGRPWAVLESGMAAWLAAEVNATRPAGAPPASR